jgi:penicillin-binding protein-related factor A (putative recombinase)
MIKLEKDYEKFLLEQALQAGMHVIPMPDDCKRSYASKGVAASVAAQKKYDFGILDQGKYYAVECKISKKPTLYATEIKSHQHTYLEEANRNGGIPLLAIYYKFRIKSKVEKDPLNDIFVECGTLIRYDVKGYTDYPFRDVSGGIQQGWANSVDILQPNVLGFSMTLRKLGEYLGSNHI